MDIECPKIAVVYRIERKVRHGLQTGKNQAEIVGGQGRSPRRFADRPNGLVERRGVPGHVVPLPDAPGQAGHPAVPAGDYERAIFERIFECERAGPGDFDDP